MWKFGKYARSNGPYDQITGKASTAAVKASTSAKRPRTKEEILANFGISGGGAEGFTTTPFGSGAPASTQNSQGASLGRGNSGYNIDRYNPVYDQLEEGTILEDWLPRDGAGLDLLFRRVYLRDPTLGPGIDILSGLPWSEYSLTGIEDKAILRIYEECMESLYVPLLMPDITKDYLILGRDVGSLIFDERRGIFSGFVPHDPDFLRITPVPVYGFDPVVDFKLTPGFKKFLNSSDPRMVDARKALPTAFLEAASSQQGFLPLDPVATVYLARKASQNDSIGTSILTRSLYFWAIEKALLNATMASTRRRSRSFMHIKAGIDNLWEPTPEELDSLAGLLIQVNEDPVGGVIATRTGVDINEPVGGGGDFYKWSDELELFAKYKMQSIGISEALLSQEANYSTAEQARSVFVENLAGLRARIVHKFFYQKLFPTIARLHGFVKRSKAELDHRIRISNPESAFSRYEASRPYWAQASSFTAQKLTQRRAQAVPVGDLLLPQIEWAKQLRPNQDEQVLNVLEQLKNNEYPVTLAQWAGAAGHNPKNIETDFANDQKLRAKLKAIEEANAGGGSGEADLSAEESEGEGGGGEDLSVEDILNAPNEEESGETAASSVHAKVKKAVLGKVSRVEQIPIWSAGKCGSLRLTEMKKVLSSLAADHKPEIFRDAAELKKVLGAKLGNEKSELAAYVLMRLGLMKGYKIDSKVAKVIAQAARTHISKHSSFTGEKALLDARRYESEIQILSKLMGSKLSHEKVKEALNYGPLPTISKDLMGGVE
jgi:hypothetical protein